MAEIRHFHCRAHCRACGAHFSSDRAFDIHRVFEDAHTGDWDHRTCLEPLDDARFAAKGRPGVCDVAEPNNPEVGVTVWTLADNLRRWQERKAVA